MRFSVDHDLGGPVELVERSLGDPEWHRLVADAATTWCPELLGTDERGGRPVVEVRYRFRGQLSGPARRVLDPATLSWVQVATIDPVAHRVDLVVVPDHHADRLRWSGWAAFTPLGDGRTRRRIEGDVRVSFPLVGGQVERAIVSGLREHAELESTVFSRYAALAR